MTSSNLSRQLRQFRLDNQLQILSAKIKAELAGTASAYTASFDHLTNTPTIHQIFTQEEVDLLLNALRYLTSSPAPEIAQEAKYTLAHVETFELKVIN